MTSCSSCTRPPRAHEAMWLYTIRVGATVEHRQFCNTCELEYLKSQIDPIGTAADAPNVPARTPLDVHARSNRQAGRHGGERAGRPLSDSLPFIEQIPQRQGGGKR